MESKKFERNNFFKIIHDDKKFETNYVTNDSCGVPVLFENRSDKLGIQLGNEKYTDFTVLKILSEFSYRKCYCR
ncbi:Hypothetical protein SRAE_0000053400 [Strongyloides ratti]|uniref:Uncharacterized protein n=1 Tax=Strongyloides ratti TaxID=34506 RepID=A0A090KV63_STRRB|nr:Hypothetical protein SRAE_0000053400 [Strongyloides ratti]CEF61410.1 Hypothetical protein SRAE_0000053400 [Strongyloides ratti]